MVPSPKGSARAVLIVDDDLGFVVWLGHTLAAGGYLTIPTTSSNEAKRLIEELRVKLCLVIANFAVSGMADYVGALQRQVPRVKVIAIRVAGTGITPMVKIDAAHSRSQSDWLATVRQVLDNGEISGAA